MTVSAKSLRRIGETTVGLTTGLPDSDQVSLFFYATDDAHAVIEASGYFNSLTALLKHGDVIIAAGVNSGTSIVKVYQISSATGAATVTTSLQVTTSG